MNTHTNFTATYKKMADGQLLLIANEGGLVDEANQALTQELNRRNLKKSDLARERESPRKRLQRETQERVIPLGRGGPTGFVFFGRHYLSEADKVSNIQLRTKWFAISGLPLVPIASYRLECEQHRWKFFRWTVQRRAIDRVPLNWEQVFLTWLKASPFYIAILALLGIWARFR